jgi:hypothetical protein
VSGGPQPCAYVACRPSDTELNPHSLAGQWGFFCSWYRHVHLMPEQRPRAIIISLRPTGPTSASGATQGIQPARWSRGIGLPGSDLSLAIGLQQPRWCVDRLNPPSTSRCAAPTRRRSRRGRLGHLGRIHRRLLGQRPGRTLQRAVHGGAGPQQGALQGHRDLEIGTAENHDKVNHRRLNGETAWCHRMSRSRTSTGTTPRRRPSPRQFRASTEPGAEHGAAC